ncbi:nitrate- and nitrite sensing domain-containing protein [Paraglaciecola sp. L3A3]|uniref:nitrate- and nitrite sensing domain-containing protein n=1 Tax=Paraglaciecola sp. L3A3 TaxID=2686358 RepID=UPI00131E37A7|nr:nitrate- and nitrite sensing domain-containing protein [Paraglaciecola sp. L3A3]
MPSNKGITKRFLYAAKVAELETLQQLSNNCVLVCLVCRVIHDLQKERGVNNVYLASSGLHYTQRRISQITSSETVIKELTDLLHDNYLSNDKNVHHYRLLHNISLALQGIENIGLLRHHVKNHDISVLKSTQAYCRLISALLNIVFEAADIASNPTISRQLVALFNFIQGKEYAGQERAWGAVGFAETSFATELCLKLRLLQEKQNTSFQLFMEFADKPYLELWEKLCQSNTTSEVLQLRKMIEKLTEGERVCSDISEVWYERTTNRIDEMYSIEHELTNFLLLSAEQNVKDAEAEISDYNKKVDTLVVNNSSVSSLLYNLHLPNLQNSFESQNEDDLGAVSTYDSFTGHKSLFELLKSQAERIDKIKHELELSQKALHEQQVISRAKALLIDKLSLSEDQAHRKLQTTAMEQNLSVFTVATKAIKAMQAQA